jgi:hypothetical protein
MTDELVARALAYPFGVHSGSYFFVDGRVEPLDYADPAAEARQPLLAFGANGSPAALAVKLHLTARLGVPVIAAELHDFDVVYSSHVSPYGAIPAALQHSPGAIAAVHVVHLLPSQHKEIRLSEPNYMLSRLNSIDLRLEDGSTLDSIRAYVTRHGCLRLDGHEIGVADIPVAGRSWPALDQRRLMALVRDELAPGENLEAFVSAHILSAELQERRTAALRRNAARFAWPDWDAAA